MSQNDMVRDIRGRFVGKPLTAAEISRCSLGCVCPDDIAIICVRHGDQMCGDGVISDGTE